MATDRTCVLLLQRVPRPVTNAPCAFFYIEAYKEVVDQKLQGRRQATNGGERTHTGNNRQGAGAATRPQLKALNDRPFLIHDAWKLAQALLRLCDDDDGKKMWEVIQGPSPPADAVQCRGFLHAKSLATGGELLNYIWLLMSYMGMERPWWREDAEAGALAKPRRGNNGVAPRPSELHKGGSGSAPSTSNIRIKVKTWFDK